MIHRWRVSWTQGATSGVSFVPAETRHDAIAETIALRTEDCPGVVTVTSVEIVAPPDMYDVLALAGRRLS